MVAAKKQQVRCTIFPSFFRVEGIGLPKSRTHKKNAKVSIHIGNIPYNTDVATLYKFAAKKSWGAIRSLRVFPGRKCYAFADVDVALAEAVTKKINKPLNARVGAPTLVGSNECP